MAALLRKEGVYSSQISTWRSQFGPEGEAGLASRRPGRRPRFSVEGRELLAAKKEVEALEKKLRVATALIALQRKAHELLALTQPEDEA